MVFFRGVTLAIEYRLDGVGQKVGYFSKGMRACFMESRMRVVRIQILLRPIMDHQVSAQD